MSPQTGRDPLVEARQARRSVAFRARAKRDLAEVRGDDDPQIKVFAPDTADVPLEFCLVLTPYAGPWKGLQLHFTVQWDLEGERQWPLVSPRIFMDPSIKHPCFPSGVINPGRTGPLRKVIDTIAEDGLRARHNLAHNPFDTLYAVFTNILHIFSAPKLIHYGEDQSYLWNMREPTIVSYLDEEGYAGLQPLSFKRLPCCQRILGCCICSKGASSRQGRWKTQWESDSRPDVGLSLDDSQPSSLSKHTTHKVKTLEPEVKRLHRIEYPTAHWLSILQSISSTVCANCPYGSSALPCIAPLIVRHGSPPDSLLVPPSLCKLDTLTYDILLEISRWLEISTLQLFGTAYPRFEELIPRLLRTRELKGTLIREPYMSFSEPILGARYSGTIGPGTERYSILETLELHDVDVIYNYGVPHEYPTLFLPLAFNAEHFGRAQKEIEERWATVDEAIRLRDKHTPSSRECSFCKESHSFFVFADRLEKWKPKGRTLHRIRAIITCMEGAAICHSYGWVQLEHMEREPKHIIGRQADHSEPEEFNNGKSEGNGEDDDEGGGFYEMPLSAGVPPLRGAGAEAEAARETERSINWYCHLLHLVLFICRAHPEIIPEAKSTIQNYVENRCRSHEQMFPADFILILTMVVAILEPDGPPPSWSPFSSPFLRKVFNDHIQEELPVLLVKEEGLSPFRLVKTFRKLKGPLRHFVHHLALVRALTETYTGNVEQLDRYCGFVDPRVLARVIRDIQLGNKVKTWRELFRLIGYEEGEGLGAARFCEMLRELLPEADSEVAPTPKKDNKRRRKVKPLEQKRKEAEKAFNSKATLW